MLCTSKLPNIMQVFGACRRQLPCPALPMTSVYLGRDARVYVEEVGGGLDSATLAYNRS